MSTVPMTKEALQQLSTTIKVQQQAINELQKRANATKSASAETRVSAAALTDTLVEIGAIPAVSRTNIMEKLASDHGAVLDAFLAFVNERGAAPRPMGGVDKSASFSQPAQSGEWGAAGSAFESAMGV